MQLTERDVLKALMQVQEPDLKKDIVTLGMVSQVEVSGKTVSFTITLTTPACPLKELIRSRCIDAVKTLDSQLEVQVNLTADVTSGRSAGPLLPGVRNIIAVASGKGGVGKSTVTANLAMALAESGATVGILDADIYGPSIPTLFRCEGAKPGVVKVGERYFIIPLEQYGVRLLSVGFLSPSDEAVVWRGPMASQALRQFITEAQWGELDYMLVDLPPGTGDIHLTLVQTLSLTGAVMVTTPQKMALVDVQRALAMFQQKQINVPVLGVVENMAYFTPLEHPESRYYIFGKDGGKTFARRYELPFLGEVPIVQGLREAADAGEPFANRDPITKAAFRQIAEGLAQQVAIRNSLQLESVSM